MHAETMIIHAIPDLINDFEISYSTSSLILSTHLIAGAAATPIAGKLSDIYSKKTQSLTETEIAKKLKVDQSTVSRGIIVLKQNSQQFVYNLAKSDLAYCYKQCLEFALFKEGPVILHVKSMGGTIIKY